VNEDVAPGNQSRLCGGQFGGVNRDTKAQAMTLRDRNLDEGGLAVEVL
jgi:hypothetical protein